MIDANAARAAAQEKQEKDAIKIEADFEKAQDDVMTLIDKRSADGSYFGFYYPPTEEIKSRMTSWLEQYGFRITYVPKPDGEQNYVCIMKISWNND